MTIQHDSPLCFRHAHHHDINHLGLSSWPSFIKQPWSPDAMVVPPTVTTKSTAGLYILATFRLDHLPVLTTYLS
ncbi:hypothetical protein PENPOL_c001G05352 [Penicillium polonicum]|uniref:Uncharacterized protein n=1 Tax=Penicillium polonicum TaxID=60169 RepID=A0A1V6P568_PENPO|nr:hypothetical protein PENPOL_c001G05352 [Penicillium polonicum]